MEQFINYFTFSDYNVRLVTLGLVILTASSALVGNFAFLRKKALVGDAVAHSVLPGICLAFILTGTKNPVYLIIGSFITGWLSLVAIDFISSRTKIKEDTAIGLVLTVFFGIGILLLTLIQHSGNSSQAGLDQFLFGRAAAILLEDLFAFSLMGVVLMIVVLLFFKEFVIVSFDKDYAMMLGMPVKRLELMLTTLTVLAVVTGIQAVGVVLMASLLITPAAAARYWTNDLIKMMVLSVFIGVISGISGALISYMAPSTPTGPWIVVIISFFAIFSFFFAPAKGSLFLTYKRYRTRRQVMGENVLKAMFKCHELKHLPPEGIAMKDIDAIRHFDKDHLANALHKLVRDGFLNRKKEFYSFTTAGFEKGKRITRLHRLWELYLMQKMDIAPDHVHESAEAMEHIITPEMEKKLTEALGHPEFDPHHSKIPYD